MAFTRISDDKIRVDKYLQETTDQGLYQLNVPGQGMSLSYVEDPHSRAQKWADNLANNAVDAESDLRGLSRFLNRDEVSRNEYSQHAVNLERRSYRSRTERKGTDQSRTTNPAWWHREQQQYRNDFTFHDPQDAAIVPFSNGVSSRVEQKN